MENEETVKSIKKEISKLGLMLPGKITTQWTQCKTKGCRFMNKENPQKHGPYNQLSFTFARKGSTMNIKEKDMKMAQQYMDNYKEFKDLFNKLVLASVAEIRRDGFGKRK